MDTTTQTLAAAPLVDPSWIARHIDDHSVRLIEVDVAAASYDAGHIPGAQLWNIYTDLRRPDYTPLDTRELEQLLTRSGVGADSTLVFYGYGAHLGYWLLSSHGHADVRLLDGPRDQWLDVGGWSFDPSAPTAVHYPLPAPNRQLHVSRNDVLAAIGQPDTVFLDVRSTAEYDGERFWPSGATEHTGRTGHIPGSIHLPIDQIRTSDGSFRPIEELHTKLRDRKLTPDHRILIYCTVGNRASQAWYALTHLLAFTNAAVYHGSWAEWGTLADTPIDRPPRAGAADRARPPR